MSLKSIEPLSALSTYQQEPGPINLASEGTPEGVG